MTTQLMVTMLALAVTEVLGQQAPTPPAEASRVDAVFAKLNSTTSPGCAVAVLRDGRIAYTRGYGMANLDHDVVITPATVFHVASVSKEFTAAAIVLLAQDGKLGLDDDVRKYVPELPDFGSRITIRHLIHHTSGLRDQWDLLGLAGWRYSLDLITDEDVLQVMSRQKALNFQPGERHLYCNTGYTLLALIVKRVSGQSLREFTAARLFGPLGMTHTHFRDDHAEIVKGQAYGYVPAGATFRLSVTNFDTAGATSLHTTVEDMALWDRNFYDARVGGRALVDQLTTPGVLNSGEPLPYAFGLARGTYRGLATVGHGGSDAGYRADFLRFPSEKLSVVCLCNLSTSNPAALTRQVADIYLADRLGPPEPPPLPSAIAIDAQELAGRAGLFWNRDTETFRKFFVKEGTLRVGFTEAGTTLTAIAPGRFASMATEYAFAADSSGRRRVTVSPRSGTDKPVIFEALDAFTPSASDAAEYAGVYRSDEVEPVYRVGVEAGKLVLRRLKLEPAVLEPMLRDVFRTDLGSIRFLRDAGGRVTGFKVTTGRAWGLAFAKQPAPAAPPKK